MECALSISHERVCRYLSVLLPLPVDIARVFTLDKPALKALNLRLQANLQPKLKVS